MNRTRWTRAWSLLGALALLLGAAGCQAQEDAQAEDPASEDSIEDDPEYPDISELPSRVRVEVSGAHAFVWEGEQEVHLTRAGAFGGGVNLLSGGFFAPEPLPEDPRTRFRWAFDVVNEYADKPGTFTLTPGGGPKGASSAFIIVMRVDDGAKPAVFDWDEVELYEQYNPTEEGCTIEIGEGVLSGTLDCPKLTEETGKSITLRASWSPA